MRTIFVLAVLAVVMSMAGWFTIQKGEDGNPTIKFNRDEIRNDAKSAISKGRDYLNRGKEQAPSNQVEQIAQQPQYPNGGYSIPPNNYQQPQQPYQVPNQAYQPPPYQNQQQQQQPQYNYPPPNTNRPSYPGSY